MLVNKLNSIYCSIFCYVHKTSSVIYTFSPHIKVYTFTNSINLLLQLHNYCHFKSSLPRLLLHISSLICYTLCMYCTFTIRFASVISSVICTFTKSFASVLPSTTSSQRVLHPFCHLQHLHKEFCIISAIYNIFTKRFASVLSSATSSQRVLH